MAVVTYASLPVAGGNLFAIALQQFGDALQWGRIAELNGLWDPWLPTDIETILLPGPASPTTDNGGLIGGPYGTVLG